MYNNNIAIENFISYCNDMMIAEEGIFSKALSHIQTLLANLILAIENKLKSCKDSNIKKTLLRLLLRANTALSKCKSLNENNPEMVKKLQEEAESIQKELDKFKRTKEYHTNEVLQQYIYEKNINALRAMLCGIINRDPTFATTNFEDMYDYIVLDNKISLNEPYRQKDTEYRKNKNQWDKDYFRINVVWLIDNFNIEKRLSYVKEIGKYVYKDEWTMGKQKAAEKQ